MAFHIAIPIAPVITAASDDVYPFSIASLYVSFTANAVRVDLTVISAARFSACFKAWPDRLLLIILAPPAPALPKAPAKATCRAMSETVVKAASALKKNPSFRASVVEDVCAALSPIPLLDRNLNASNSRRSFPSSLNNL